MSTRTWPTTDHYATLGVAPGASDAEIARVFRARAMLLHPDRSPDVAETERFKELAAAYAVLGNPPRRADYDAARRTTPRPRAGAARRVVAEPDAHRPLSVRFLADRRKSPWAVGGGVTLVVAGLVAVALLLALQTSEPATATGVSTGPSTLARDITFWVVAAKLVVVGFTFVLLGARRRRYP